MQWSRQLLAVVTMLSLAALAQGADFDANGDGSVDLDDYNMLAGCFLGPNVDPGSLCLEDFDDDFDGDVDLADVDAFIGAFTGVVEPPVPAQLAGNPLAEFPHFEYVRAFWETESLHVAVDPNQYPQVAGVTADIYVVAARTVGDWTADPELVDVRIGGPQEVTFTGTDIQSNTFQVAAASELDGNAGTGLGVGHDVVIDLDGDGMLSGGDLIDGYEDEAGLYVCRDTSLPGPLATTVIEYSGGTWLDERTYFPTDIANYGKLPVVIISHGNGHRYFWYDYLQEHLASYGFVVMSHSNNTQPGIETASISTLQNTDYFFANQGSIGGGVLDGHLDEERIIWIGHSRGGEGVARAYDRILDGVYTPTYFSADGLILISSIAPTDFLGTNSSNPHDKAYHLIAGSGDGDVSGSPASDVTQYLHIAARATQFRSITQVQGTGHNEFNCCGFFDFTGPDYIGRAETQIVTKGYYLPLIKFYAEGNIPAADFLYRQYESFRPPSTDADTVVSIQYRDGEAAGNYVIDDFQTNSALNQSSSGGAVSYTVQNIHEGRLDDANTSFTWTASDPMNGMTYSSSSDQARGLVFDWSSGQQLYLEFEVPTDARDMTRFDHLSFRACQGTRHPRTIAELSDLNFSVSLRDTSGATSTINIAAYGGGVEEPFQRTGSGTGTGWLNEFETIRFRLTDFLTNGSDLDLSNVEAIRFDFGSNSGSNQGRLGFDDLALTVNYTPEVLGASLELGDVLDPSTPPGTPITIPVVLSTTGEEYVEGTGKAFYRYDGGTFETVDWTHVAGELYEVTLPAPLCGDEPEFYFQAVTSVSGMIRLPDTAPADALSMAVGAALPIYTEPFDQIRDFEVTGNALAGIWECAVPEGGGTRGDPPLAFGGEGRCALTDWRDGDTDVDGGTTTFATYNYDLTGLYDPWIAYARWFSNDQGGAPQTDPFVVEVSDDGGDTWVLLEQVGPEGAEAMGGWHLRGFRISDYVEITDQFRIRWSAADLGDESIVEAGVDALEIFDLVCE
jgi:hypothetical protein